MKNNSIFRRKYWF